MNLYTNPYLSTLLESVAEELDIPPALHEEAVLNYEDVGDWLGAPGSPLEKYTPEIYPQGSFRLGTVVRPVRKNGEFDKAINDYAEALRLEPKESLALIGRGGLWAAKKDYAKAIDDYTEAIRLDPKNEYAFFSRGKTWSRKYEYK